MIKEAKYQVNLPTIEISDTIIPLQCADYIGS